MWYATLRHGSFAVSDNTVENSTARYGVLKSGCRAAGIGHAELELSLGHHHRTVARLRYVISDVASKDLTKCQCHHLYGNKVALSPLGSIVRLWRP